MPAQTDSKGENRCKKSSKICSENRKKSWERQEEHIARIAEPLNGSGESSATWLLITDFSSSKLQSRRESEERRRSSQSMTTTPRKQSQWNCELRTAAAVLNPPRPKNFSKVTPFFLSLPLFFSFHITPNLAVPYIESPLFHIWNWVKLQTRQNRDDCYRLLDSIYGTTHQGYRSESRRCRFESGINQNMSG